MPPIYPCVLQRARLKLALPAVPGRQIMHRCRRLTQSQACSSLSVRALLQAADPD